MKEVSEKVKGVKNSVFIQVRNHVRKHTLSPDLVPTQTWLATWDRVVMHEIRNLIPNFLTTAWLQISWSLVRDQVRNQVTNPVRDQIRTEVWGQIWDQMVWNFLI